MIDRLVSSIAIPPGPHAFLHEVIELKELRMSIDALTQAIWASVVAHVGPTEAKRYKDMLTSERPL